MDCNLPKIAYSTIRTLLRAKLSEATYPKLDIFVKKVTGAMGQNDFSSDKFRLLLKSASLKRVRNDTFAIVYQSAIALRLSSVLRRDSLALAYQILTEFHQEDVKLCQENLTDAQRILSDFTSKVVSPGLLQFELGDRGLSIWLQCLTKLPLQASSSESRPPLTPSKPFIQTLQDSEQLFVCQHSHARCCSLLRLARGSVATNCSETNALDDQGIVLTVDPIPWLTTQGHLCLTNPAERALISQMVATVDDLSDLITAPQSSLKSALALSHSFQNFYRTCQILEFASPSSLQRQSRLSLVRATQRLLRHLLEVGLNAKAPPAL